MTRGHIMLVIAAFNAITTSSKYLLVELEEQNDSIMKPQARSIFRNRESKQRTDISTRITFSIQM